MKLKFLSLICALGLLAFGTSVMAQDAKVKAPTAPTKEMKAPAGPHTKIEAGHLPALLSKEEASKITLVKKEGTAGEKVSLPDACTPGSKFDAAACAKGIVHTFATTELCSSDSIKTNKACGNVCAPPANYVPTLNDLACCVKAAKITKWTHPQLALELYASCNALDSMSTTVCVNATAQQYAGWLCCSYDPTSISTCVKPKTCADYAPTKCTPESMEKK